MRFFIFSTLILFAFITAEATDASRLQYLQLVKDFPKFISSPGDFTKGEIQIVLDPMEMASIEKDTQRDVGVIMQDKYWLWVNDACIFPNGKKGVYGRILWVKSLEATPGVVVMPITADDKIILNCNYRHATRSWEIELPRGCVNFGEEIEAAAKRETMEETGMLVDDLFLLGEITPDTGSTNSVIPIYVARVIEKQNSQLEDSEAIEDILYMSITEVKQAFIRGYYDHEIRGVQKRIPFRDPFLAYSILIYELKK